jgi:hypothetical protein
MKSTIRMSDFWHIIDKQQRGEAVEIVGIILELSNEKMLKIKPVGMTIEEMLGNAIVAIFEPQEGPKDSWETRDYSLRRELKKDLEPS